MIERLIIFYLDLQIWLTWILFRSADFFLLVKNGRMSFLYDSLDTVKKLKYPTKKEITELTIAIFAVVIVSGLIFVALDTVFSGLYRSVFFAVTSG